MTARGRQYRRPRPAVPPQAAAHGRVGRRPDAGPARPARFSFGPAGAGGAVDV